MAKRKKKDRFYIKIAKQYPEGRRTLGRYSPSFSSIDGVDEKIRLAKSYLNLDELMEEAEFIVDYGNPTVSVIVGRDHR